MSLPVVHGASARSPCRLKFWNQTNQSTSDSFLAQRDSNAHSSSPTGMILMRLTQDPFDGHILETRVENLVDSHSGLSDGS